MLGYWVGEVGPSWWRCAGVVTSGVAGGLGCGEDEVIEVSAHVVAGA